MEHEFSTRTPPRAVFSQRTAPICKAHKTYRRDTRMGLKSNLIFALQWLICNEKYLQICVAMECNNDIAKYSFLSAFPKYIYIYTCLPYAFAGLIFPTKIWCLWVAVTVLPLQKMFCVTYFMGGASCPLSMALSVFGTIEVSAYT